MKDVETVKEQQIDDIVNSQVFKVLSEPIRIDIIKYLVLNGSADIGTIAQEFPQDRSVISRHLKMMHDEGLLLKTKESRYVVYQFNGLAFLKQLENMTERVREMLTKNCPEYKEVLAK